MNKIKEIHTFGTSHTEGGGFEFEYKPELFELYKDSGEEFKKFNFSWPGQLQKLSNIKVVNHAKSGYGDERMYRKFFKILSETSLEDLDGKLFIFEFAQVGRKEYYCNSIDSHVINNYWGVDNEGNNFHNFYEYNTENLIVSVTNDYQNHTPLLTTEIQDVYVEFFKKTYNTDITHETISRNGVLFLSTLNELNINYFVVSRPFFTKDDFSRFLLHGITDNEIHFKEGYCDLVSYIIDNKLTITDETNGEHQDGHAGLVGNKILAKIIYESILKKSNKI